MVSILPRVNGWILCILVKWNFIGLKNGGRKQQQQQPVEKHPFKSGYYDIPSSISTETLISRFNNDEISILFLFVMFVTFADWFTNNNNKLINGTNKKSAYLHLFRVLIGIISDLLSYLHWQNVLNVCCYFNDLFAYVACSSVFAWCIQRWPNLPVPIIRKNLLCLCIGKIIFWLRGKIINSMEIKT